MHQNYNQQLLKKCQILLNKWRNHHRIYCTENVNSGPLGSNQRYRQQTELYTVQDGRAWPSRDGHALPWPWEERHGQSMARVNQTRPHYVNQTGKTHSKPLAARHGRGMARAWHAMCESALTWLHKHLAYAALCSLFHFSSPLTRC